MRQRNRIRFLLLFIVLLVLLLAGCGGGSEAEAFYNQGADKIDGGKYDTAIEDFDQAIELEAEKRQRYRAPDWWRKLFGGRGEE